MGVFCASSGIQSHPRPPLVKLVATDPQPPPPSCDNQNSLQYGQMSWGTAQSHPAETSPQREEPFQDNSKHSDLLGLHSILDGKHKSFYPSAFKIKNR